ncbi:diguanylate phosphodiesterase (plasmid) [Novosphingobium aromaticivorans DSM 12444]|uniref:Diguanylate phosphodiesterase n=1 Tax=Novosphingobium aromaticivorans (strain ATCC 700278 / DSM 12444 / CCUG 56034 / CIP 105152 / NBRC 16084 / F199) TaxID=279238 RepID=A4XFC9_NOVAD|nr:EAL domain-containing protein [Novosphingobium aromaticivorans]ABP64640.1 diguanylate phosphodiesterase [Novosphingobium aromaticivorans DSM 12444]SCY91958.1 EAL domain, c-di-GMP-specific phosphodiesterase class I (or its enzymatically inactive variant) [Novosphingobium aromaticivorans]
MKPVDYDLLIAAVEGHLHNAALRQAAARAAPGSDGSADEREALLARLAASPAGEGVAVAKIDTQPELARRLAGKDADYLSRLVHRLAHRRGLAAFRLHSHAWALTGDDGTLTNTLAPMVDMQFRDRGALGIATARITLSVVTGRTSDMETPEVLVDRLMESARLLQRDGGGRMLALDGPDMSEIRLATSIRTELVTAIRQGQLHVCFQPKVDAESGAPVSAEVLVRWESPLLGHLSPATFIPVVERAGLLGHVTDWVLRQAAASQVALRNAGLPARLAVNIGASEFNDALPSRIARIFAEHSADESLLEVEVTETSVLTDPAEADLIVQALHARGIAVALDDFGTGYSSLAHLQACAVDTIKIDRSFVKRVAESGPDQKIVLGIISLARMLGMETVAEGVELESQRAWLTEHDCDTLQGYVISRPLRFEDYCALLEEWLGKASAGPA